MRQGRITDSYGQVVRSNRTSKMQAHRPQPYGRKGIKLASNIKSLLKKKGGSRTAIRQKRKRGSNQLSRGDESYVRTKTIKYKSSKLDKFASFIGGETIHETQHFDLLYHDPGDMINTQKTEYVADIFASIDTQAIMNIAYSNLPGSAPLVNNATTIVANAGSSYKYYLNSCKFQSEWTNMSAGESTLTIYVVMAKNTRSTSFSALDEWNEGMDDASGAAGQAAVSVNTLGSSPTTSKLFNMQWKVVDKQIFKAQAGAKVQYNFNFSPRSLVDSEYWARHTYVKGLTYQIFALAHGQLGLTATQTIVPKPVQWIYTARKRYTIKAVNHFPRSITQVYELPALTVAAAGAVSVMEDDGNIKT